MTHSYTMALFRFFSANTISMARGLSLTRLTSRMLVMALSFFLSPRIFLEMKSWKKPAFF